MLHSQSLGCTWPCRLGQLRYCRSPTARWLWRVGCQSTLHRRAGRTVHVPVCSMNTVEASTLASKLLRRLSGSCLLLGPNCRGSRIHNSSRAAARTAGAQACRRAGVGGAGKLYPTFPALSVPFHKRKNFHARQGMYTPSLGTANTRATVRGCTRTTRAPAKRTLRNTRAGDNKPSELPRWGTAGSARGPPGHKPWQASQGAACPHCQRHAAA